MADPKNALQAALDRAKAPEMVAPAEPRSKAKPKPAKVVRVANDKKAASKADQKTTLIGGHFSLDVAKQLAIISAEERVTKQALLAEALDLLFVKKGKERIASL